MFEYPSKAMRFKYWFTGTPFLSGFEKCFKDGTDWRMNFILSNGQRSTQIDKGYETKYTHMIPADALNKIRSATIHYWDERIIGLSFFDKDGALLWEHGYTT